MSVFLTSEYYIVFMNPNIHKREWNTMRTIMKTTQINYCVFINYDLKYLEFYPVSKQEFNDYKYNPN